MLFRLHDLDALAVGFEQVIISLILFIVLFADQIIICSTSAAQVPLVLTYLLDPSALAVADFEQVTAPVICFLVMFPTLFANQMLICFMSAAHVSPVLSPLNLQCVS